MQGERMCRVYVCVHALRAYKWSGSKLSKLFLYWNDPEVCRNFEAASSGSLNILYCGVLQTHTMGDYREQQQHGHKIDNAHIFAQAGKNGVVRVTVQGTRFLLRSALHSKGRPARTHAHTHRADIFL